MIKESTFENIMTQLNMAAESLAVARKAFAPKDAPGSVAWDDHWVHDYTNAVKRLMKVANAVIYYVLELQDKAAPDRNIKWDVMLRARIEALAGAVNDLEKYHRPKPGTEDYE